MPLTLALATTILLLSQLQGRVGRGFWTSKSRKFVRFTPAERCILYDRPPRTGSTTISAALNICLKYKQYSGLLSTPRHGRENVIIDMLKQKEPYRTSVRSHLVLSRRDVSDIEQTCREFLYISSTSSMATRLLSQVKYGMFEGHGNQTVTAKDLINSVNRRPEESIQEQEAFLESYPYSVNEDIDEEDRLNPHFIVRQEFLEEDISALLRALRCENVTLNSDNIHSVVNTTPNETEPVAKVFRDLRGNITLNMQMNDHRYRTMVQQAQSQNIRGLLHAHKF